LNISIPVDVASQERPITIESCIQQQLGEEQVSETEKLECSGCHKRVRVLKTTQFCRFPPVLVLQLKRFKLDERKNEEFVKFPVKNLDLSKFAYVPTDSTKPVYDLYGVCNHLMSNPHHYTAYVLNEDQGWYEYDDSRVTGISVSKVVSKNAYFLFYKRQDIEEERETQAAI
jgi:ubiquitin C-terminal hydrolase